MQQQHTIACSGYKQQIVRTGYESIIGQRTSDMFCLSAKQPGKVIKKDKRAIVVQYADGKTVGCKLGRRFGTSDGLTIPHDIVTDLKEGDTFEVGNTIAYNSGFFEPDFFNPKIATFKNNIYARTVLWETSETLDDASAVSRKICDQLTTHLTKVKHIVVRFDQVISNLIKPGTSVDYETPLCFIEEEFTATAKLFGDTSLNTLRDISTQVPKAGVQGIVEKIEIYYHGDLEDMSPSLIHYANISDAELKAQAKAQQSPVYTGKVDSGYRIDGNPLGFQNVAIKVYITSRYSASIGDKGVFANQLKTVFSGIMEKPYVSEDGKEVDAIFGFKSVDARVVNSAVDNGSTATLIIACQDKFISIYRNKE